MKTTDTTPPEVAERRDGTEVTCLGASADGKWLAVGTATGDVHLHHLAKQSGRFQVSILNALAQSVAMGALSSGLNPLVHGLAPQISQVLARPDGVSEYGATTGERGAVVAIDVWTRGDEPPLVACALSNGEILWGDPSEGTIERVIAHHPEAASGVAVGWGPEGQVAVASCSAVGTLDLWLEDRETTIHIEHLEASFTAITTVAAEPPFFVVGDAGGGIWTLVPGQSGAIRSEIDTHGREVTALASGRRSNGKLRVAIGLADGFIELYSVRHEGDAIVFHPKPARKAHDGPVTSLAFQVDGKGHVIAVSGGDDGIVSLWPVEVGRSKSVEHGKPIVAVTGARSGSDGAPVVAFTEGRELIEVAPITDLLAEEDARPDVWGVRDEPIEGDEDDQLGFKAYAEALAYLIDHPNTGTPLTIAIDAPWGMGKTSLGKLVEKRLGGEHGVSWTNEGNVSHITCWFNAWMHDDADNLATPVAATVAGAVAGQRPWWTRIVRPVPAAFLPPKARTHRRRVLIASLVASFGVAMALVAAFAEGLPGLVAGWFNIENDPASTAFFGLSTTALIALGTKTVGWTVRASDAIARYVDNPAGSAKSASVISVWEKLGRLIEDATRPRRRLALRYHDVYFGRWPHHWRPHWEWTRERRFVLFVDDLERCVPPRAVDVCHTVNQMLRHPNVVTVLLVDMNTIVASAQVKYADITKVLSPSGDDRSRFGHAFLEKIVQFHLSLPQHPEDKMRDVFSAALKGPRAAPAEDTDESEEDSEEPAEATQETQPERESEGARLVRVLLAVGRAVLAVAAYRPSLKTVIGVVTALAGIAGLWISDPGAWIPRVWEWIRQNSEVAAAIAVSLVASLAGLPVDRFREEARKRDALRQKVLIDSILSGSEADTYLSAPLGDAVQEVGKKIPEEDRPYVSPTFLRTQVRRKVLEDSSVRRDAEDEAALWTPPVPRSAKRLANRLQVMLALAVEVDLMVGESPVEPRHIGKWAALTERWPTFASSVLPHPNRMRDLEFAAADEVRFTRKLKDLAIDVDDVETLRSLCNREPLLSRAMRELAHYSPTP